MSFSFPSAGLYTMSFTLFSFAKMYADIQGGGFDYTVLASKLWGDRYFDPATRRFSTKPVAGKERTFVEFILEPVYKIVSCCVGEDAKKLQDVMAEFGTALKPSQLHMSSKPLMRCAFKAVFGDATGLTDMITEHIPSAREGTAAKVAATYSGNHGSALVEVRGEGKDVMPGVRGARCFLRGRIRGTHDVSTNERPPSSPSPRHADHGAVQQPWASGGARGQDGASPER